MIFSANTNIEDKILERVLAAPYQIKSLHAELTLQDSSISLKAIYNAVNKLIDSGVLIKAGRVIRVNEEWLQVVRERLVPTPSLQISEGERLVHSFTSIAHLDVFWTTIAIQLERFEKDGQIFFYNPHNFWAYIPERKRAEKEYYEHFSKSKLHAFFTIGGDSAADIEFKREYQDEYLQIDTRLIAGLPRTEHITIMGDFIITVRISKTVAAKIDELYLSGKPIKELEIPLVELYSKTFSCKFVLESNPIKAERLRKKLALNFYFRKE